jgi:hypothetical protein
LNAGGLHDIDDTSLPERKQNGLLPLCYPTVRNERDETSKALEATDFAERLTKLEQMTNR